MEFNPDKCEVIRISRKKSPVIFPYTLHNITLKSVDTAKYLGITISKDLSWNKHIDNITASATNTLRFIKRNVKTHNLKVKEAAYTTYVRPQLEYCSTVWHPWQKNLTNQIERVQRAAARYVCNNYDYTCSVTQMFSNLNWHTLEHRRMQNSVLLLYKIQHHIVSVDHHHLVSTRNFNFLIPQSRTQYHINSFFPRSIRYWNSLPTYVQSSPSLSTFKERLAAVSF